MGDSSTLSLAFYLDPFTSLCWQKQTSLNSIRLVIFFFFFKAYTHFRDRDRIMALPSYHVPSLASVFYHPSLLHSGWTPASLLPSWLFTIFNKTDGGEARVLQHDVRMGKEQEALLKSRLPSEGSRTLWFVCLSFLIKSGEGHRWLQTQAKSPKA